MNLTGVIKVYRKDFDGKAVYSRSIASKKYEGGQVVDEWIRVYQRVQLPKGDELPDGTKIDVKHGFEAVYSGQNGQPLVKLIVMKYDIVEEDPAVKDNEAEAPDGFTALQDDDIPFA